MSLKHEPSSELLHISASEGGQSRLKLWKLEVSGVEIQHLSTCAVCQFAETSGTRS